jgi:D-inositol-3-phosphate glycosyltransferase
MPIKTPPEAPASAPPHSRSWLESKFRGFVQKYGPEVLKRRMWNTEFAAGKWDYLDRSGDDRVHVKIEKYANNGNVLDLGCGSGTTGLELRPEAYSAYTGVDISEVAIEKARGRAAEAGRAAKNDYCSADILTYQPPAHYDVIFFGESLYYIRPSLLLSTLNRYGERLKAAGVFIVRVFDAGEKNRQILDCIEQSFDVVEKLFGERDNSCLIVFRSKSGELHHSAEPGNAKRSHVPPSNPSVALLTGGTDPHYASGLATALAGVGLHVDVIGSDLMDTPEMRSTPGIRVLNLQGSLAAPGFGAKLGRLLRFYLRLASYTWSAPPQIFHILWNNKLEVFDRTALTLWYKLLGKKIVLTAHNVNAGRRDSRNSTINRLSLKCQYRLADRLFVHTELMKRELVGEFGVRQEHVIVIPYGVNNAVPETGLTPADARRDLGLGDSERVILFFGAIKEYKGLTLLIEAFDRASDPDGLLRLVIAGEPKKGHERHMAAVLSAIERSPRRAAITSKLDFIPDHEIERYFKAADVTVLPYTSIFQSGILFLAYRFGLPVIATDVGSFREDVIEGETGFVCRSGDPAELAQTIDRYFAHDLFRNLSAGRRRIAEFYHSRNSWDKAASITRAVYADLQLSS